MARPETARRVAVARPPRHPALRRLVDLLWVDDGRPAPTPEEWALPSGAPHLAFRACGTPLRVDGRRFDGAVIGGPRVGRYRRDTPGGTRSIGAVLAPWAPAVLLGVPGAALRGDHVPLADLWGPGARTLEDRLHAFRGPAALDALEAALVTRLADPPRPGLPAAVDALRRGVPPDAVAADLGCSARHLRQLVGEVTGLTPREHRRLARLEALLARVQAHPDEGWAARALALGFADQAHLCRELRALTGLTATRYAPLPGAPRHVPIRSPDRPSPGAPPVP